jgi:Zn-dependent M28 family amino/carboxypeptidase
MLGLPARLAAEVRPRMVDGTNVAALLRGADPALAHEVVIVGAHHDHLGWGGEGSLAPDTRAIHNGADDNASGSASLLEIAKRLMTGSRPARSVLFLAFGGEERGLLGSSHYVENPLLPLERTVAMLNLDMVGRANGRVNVSGLERYARLEQLLHAAAEGGGLAIRREGPGPGRSDDANFLNRRIPAFHFFTGFHDDYHEPGDDWEKLDAPGTARVARLALEFAARIAAERTRPTFAD